MPTKTPNGIDIKTMLLVHGYIRVLDIKHQIIPTSIINLLIEFYYFVAKIIYIEQNDNGHKLPTICISKLTQKQNYQFDAQLLLNTSIKNVISCKINPGCYITSKSYYYISIKSYIEGKIFI